MRELLVIISYFETVINELLSVLEELLLIYDYQFKKNYYLFIITYLKSIVTYSLLSILKEWLLIYYYSF